MARDEFTKAVIDRLRMRVANRYSNPECRVPTTGPSELEDKVINIGIAAHISAASPGGPRYLCNMTTKERKAINNAIWLCSNCSTKIDRDEKGYSIPLLNKWKADAESSANYELGKRLPGKNDAIDIVSAAFTGLPNSFLPTAIPNVHKASELSLESLDPRFTVKSSYSEKSTQFILLPKENIEFSMNIHIECAKEYIEKYKRLVEHGEDLEIKSNAVSFKGSKLLEVINSISHSGKMIISSPKKKGIQKIWLLNKSTGLIETFEDIHGEISLGNKTFDFEGTACNEIFSFRYRIGLNENDATSTFGINFYRWDECDIRFLPYLSNFLSFYEKMAKGWDIFTSLEILITIFTPPCLS